MTPGAPGRLYVFLQGLMVIGEKNNQFEIAIPAVDGHVYKAGSWLAETPIAAGAVLTLTNVTAGAASIRPLDFLIDVPVTYPITQNGRAATLWVPKPKEVLGLLLAPSVGRLQGSTGPYQSLADVVVLVYDFADENQVYLDQHDWEPYSTGGAINLHVIATSEKMEGQFHEDQSQLALKRVYQNFPGLDYVKQTPKPQVASWVDPNSSSFGKLYDKRTAGARPRRTEGMYVVEPTGELAFPLAALEHPSSRVQRLNRLGRMHMERRRIEGIWHYPDPVGSSDGSPCGPTSGNYT
jgi:hypothetical protein